MFISIVIPAYNEERVLPAFHKRLSAVLASLSGDAEILYVDDGSSDGTWSIVQQLCQEDPRVAILRMSRNFGKEIAMTAGLDHANGDAVVLIDADLQDPPELIPELLKHWRDGYDVVYAKRTAREGESMIKMATAYTFGQNV